MNANNVSWLAPLGLLFITSCDQQGGSNQEEPKTPEAMYQRAEALLKPNIEGDASDFKGALVYLRKAAEAGYRQAQTDLGGLYLAGGKEGLEADAKEAYHWFSQAAEQGSAQARCFMAEMLYQGAKDLEQDKDEAIKQWKLAIDAGLPEAMRRLGKIYIQGGEQVEQGLQLLERAAKAGLSSAAMDLAYIYARGVKGVELNMKTAAHWYKQAAAYGNAQALYIVALMELDGEYLAQDEEQAMRRLRLSAGQDFLPAIRLLIQRIRQAPLTDELKREADAWEERLKELEKKAKS